MTDAYHEGERLVQERAGVRERAEKVGRIVRPELSAAFVDFLTDRDLVVLTTIDEAGRPWVSPATGEPGFVSVSDPRTIRIGAASVRDADVRRRVAERPAIGLLAIDLAARRRVRVNGRGRVSVDGSLEIDVEQCYGNCPKYIQQRESGSLEPAERSGRIRRGHALSQPQRRRIAASDTFFIGTNHADRGADASHRGGRPGFVELIDVRRLVFPDYAGNSMFQTLGNLAVDPRAGLLFIDFETGSTLQLTGRARVDWDAERAARFPGAERVVEFEIDAVVEAEAALGRRWLLRAYSPVNPG